MNTGSVIAGALASAAIAFLLWAAFTVARYEMSAQDKAAWAGARSLPEVADLTARWLTGELAAQPGYFGKADVDEDRAPGMTSALIACNRAGFLTYGSQAGAESPGFDGAGWRLVAAAEGLIPADRLTRLRPAAADAGLLVDASGAGQVVTWRAGRPYTVFGSRRDDLADDWTGYGICHPDAIAELEAAQPVVVYDPDPGRNDRLWPALARFAQAAASDNGAES